MRSVGVSRLILGHKIATFERPHHSHSLIDSQVLAEQFSSTFLFSTPARLELQSNFSHSVSWNLWKKLQRSSKCCVVLMEPADVFTRSSWDFQAAAIPQVRPGRETEDYLREARAFLHIFAAFPIWMYKMQNDVHRTVFVGFFVSFQVKINVSCPYLTVTLTHPATRATLLILFHALLTPLTLSVLSCDSTALPPCRLAAVKVLSRTSIFGAIILALLFVLPNLIELVTSLGMLG